MNDLALSWYKKLKKIPLPFLIIIFGVIFLLPFSGTFELTAITEGEYSGVAREMFKRKDLISPFFNGQFWADKPPLHLWMMVLTGWLGRWSEFSLRLPGMIMTILTSLLTYKIGEKYFSKKIAFVAAMVFLTCIETVVSGQIIFVDMTLTFFLVLAFYSFFNFFIGQKKKRYIYYFFLACAGAVMTKGLIGIIIPAGSSFVYMLWKKEFKILKTNIKDLSLGFLIFLVITVPWFAIEVYRHGDAFVQKFFIYFNIQRFVKGVDNPNPWYYYFLFIPIMLFPWSSFMKIFISSFCQMKNRKFAISVASFTIFTLAFFTISRTKLYTYLLPLYPLWSLMFAYGWIEFWGKKEVKFWKFFSGTLIIFPLAIVALYISASHVNGQNLANLTYPLIIVFSLVLVAIFAGIGFKLKSGNYYFALFVLMILMVNLILKSYLMPYVQDNFLYIKDFCQIINQEYKSGDKIGVMEGTATNAVFYTQKKIDFQPDVAKYLSQKERVFLIAPKSIIPNNVRIIKEKAGWSLVSNK